MENVARWATEAGHPVEPSGFGISARLVKLACHRLPAWMARIHMGNALGWSSPRRFDFVRTEFAYVPDSLRRRYVEQLLSHAAVKHGRLILYACRASPAAAARRTAGRGTARLGYRPGGSVEARDADGGVLTRVVWLDR